MKNKLSIIVSSIAACALFASIFAFNGFAFDSSKLKDAVASNTTVSQLIKTSGENKATNSQPASASESKKENNPSNTKAVNVNTTSAKNTQNSTTCPTPDQTQSTVNNQANNEQTANIKSADISNKLQSVINNSDCNNTTAKTNNYSAIKEKLKALLKSKNGTSATAPSTNNSTTKPSTSTPATNTSTNGDYSAFQKKVVELVNAERSKNGLKPLTMNAELSKVATLKSQDMAKLNYFDHNSPTYGSPFDMMKKYGISYKTAGENIAMGQTSPEQVMQGWMNSPGHRANILKSSFTQIGVGVAKNSSGRLYWTQQFIG